MSRRANKIRKQIRAEEIAQEKRLTDGNSDWKRRGSRDPQHAKHTPNHSPYDNNGNGSRPPRALEVFYDTLWCHTLIRYERLGDVPQQIVGQHPTIVVVDGHVFAYLSNTSGPVSKLARRLNVDDRHFWPGRYSVGGRQILSAIGDSGDKWNTDAGRSSAYKQLRAMTEKVGAEPAQAPPAAQSKLETLATSPTMLVVYPDYPGNIPGIDRSILVLDVSTVPDNVLGRSATRQFELLGYNAAYFRIDSSHTLAAVANTLGIAPNNVRVGHYSDFGGNFLDDVLKGNSYAASSTREIFKIANIPKRNGTPSEKSHGGI